MARPGLDRTPAVQRQDVYEIKSPLILQPGPAALTDGLAKLQNIIQGRACAMIKGTLTGLPMGGARAAFGRSEHVWGFTHFTPAHAGGWDATFFDEKGLPRASCTVARGEVGCK
jgi:hypothetical protein